MDVASANEGAGLCAVGPTHRVAVEFLPVKYATCQNAELLLEMGNLRRVQHLGKRIAALEKEVATKSSAALLHKVFGMIHCEQDMWSESMREFEAAGAR